MTVAVYDTNVLISGIFWRGLPRQAIHLARQGKVRVVTCQALLDELGDVLVRANKPFRLSEEEAARVISDVLNPQISERPRAPLADLFVRSSARPAVAGEGEL